MFTCNFKQQCIRDEEIAKRKHFGNAKGFKLLWKKLTWHDWERTNCSAECSRFTCYHVEQYSKFCKSKTFEQLMKMQGSRHEYETE